MISVNVKRDNDIITEIKIRGHAKYDEYGKDIVCSGVSSALITTVNAILSFDKDAIYYEDGNNFYLKNIKKDEITNKLLDNLINILNEVESKYKENIKVKEE